MSSSVLYNNVFQAKIGNVQNQADSTSVYSNGVWSFKNSTALTSVTIDNSGNVGVGATTTSAKLTIKNPNVSGEQQILDIQNAASTGQIASLSFNQTDDMLKLSVKSGTGYLAFGTGATGTERMRIDAGGALSFQTATQSSSKAFFIKNNGETGNGRCSVTLDSGNTNNSSCKLSFEKNSGNLWNIFNDISANNGTDFAIWSSSSGGVTLSSNTATSWSPRSSDERKKKNFETTQGLSEVLQIEPVKYHFNSEEDSATKRLGFKAQNLQAVIPEMVHPTGEKAEDGSDYLTITPDYILPVLVKAIQEQQAMIESMKVEIEALKAK